MRVARCCLVAAPSGCSDGKKKSKSKKGTYFPDLGLQYSTVPYSTVRVPSRVGWSRPYSISVFGSILILLLLKALAYWPLDELEGIDGLLL